MSVTTCVPTLVERQAQQVAQPRQHGVGGLDVAVHQRRDGVERVEQEVRVQLALQRLQLRFGEPRLELRRRDGALLRLAVIVAARGSTAMTAQ